MLMPKCYNIEKTNRRNNVNNARKGSSRTTKSHWANY
jgi:hypothetical protein